MNYSLTIAIDATDQQAIVAAGQFVTIVQFVTPSVQSTAALTGPRLRLTTTTSPAIAVAWATFSPFTSNTVTWTDSYELYASMSPSQAGTVIGLNAQQASPTQGYMYPFAQNAFGQPTSGSGPGYLVQNAQGMAMTFGLATVATVNSVSLAASALNATTVLNQEVASFQPTSSVGVLLSTIALPNTVFTLIGSMYMVPMTTGTGTVTYANGTFSS
jgi:hypothetical protein